MKIYFKKKRTVKKYMIKHLNTTFKCLEEMKSKKIHVKIIPYVSTPEDNSFYFGHMSTLPDKPWILVISEIAFDEDVVEETVVHELCHLAVYCMYGVEEDMHGPEFKKYLKMAKKATGLNLRQSK